MLSSRRLILLLCAALSPLALASPAGAVVGGSDAAIQDFPFQVALLQTSVATNYSAQFCGGSIRDPTHIVTAGHCVFDSLRKGRVARPSQVAVLAGTPTLSQTGAAGRLAVREISMNPDFDDATLDNDSAVLTLQSALTLRPGTNEDLISPVTSTDWAGVSPGDPLVVSGWGNRSSAPDVRDFPATLQEATVPYVGDPTCEADYTAGGASVNGPLTVCAGTGRTDACQGDSGGPLVRAFGNALPDDYMLVGIVSSGIGCADAAFPGLYTEVAAPSVRDYIVQSNPVPAPDAIVDPSLTGTAAVGSTLTCVSPPENWSGSPTLTTQWVSTRGTVDTALTGIGAPNDYAVQPGDAGSTISCIVRARNAGGRAIVRSPPSGVVPQPSPAVTPEPQVPSTPAPPPVALQDDNAPVARILTAKCVKTTCTLTVNVTDAGVSSGIAKVAGSVRSTYRKSCTRNGRRTTCARHKTRSFTGRRTVANHFTIKVAKLPVGTQFFALVATDKAGHQQLLPTRKTLRTRRR